MSYTKNIAVIKELKAGFSADGGALSGLIKAEKYGSDLIVEVSYLNFAPLSEGRYVCAVSDGEHTVVVENGRFEGKSEVDTSNGFGALVCYINGGVFPVASAVCGNYHFAVIGIKEDVEKQENAKTDLKKYDDDAIAEDNYYEYENNEDGGAVREDKAQEEDGSKAGADEAAVGAFEKETRDLDKEEELPPEYTAFNGLAGGNFYEKTKKEIENIFNTYPCEENLQKLIEGSRWAKIDYGDGKYYVFGVLYGGDVAEYLCYGVPTEQSSTPPESMKDLAVFIPVADGERDRGFWIMYQDAKTGASIKVKNV